METKERTGLKYFIERLEQVDPKHVKAVRLSRDLTPELFDVLGDRVIHTLLTCFPELTVEQLVESYAFFTMEQNLLQFRYEQSGRYPVATHQEANEQIYQSRDVMTGYMASLLLTQMLWSHHLELVKFFLTRFVDVLPAGPCMVLELAPGHGLLGRLLLERRPAAILTGLDISPTAVEMSRALASTEGLGARAIYRVGDAVNDPLCAAGKADAVIAGELLEHLDQPELLFRALGKALRPTGRAYVTAAITAANFDHVYEFRSADEVLRMASQEHLRVVDQLLALPRTVRHGATRIPQVLGMILAREATP
jgi:SAM-dependent methyltransferase